MRISKPFLAGVFNEVLKGKPVPVNIPTVTYPFSEFGDRDTAIIEQQYLCLGNTYKAPSAGDRVYLESALKSQLPLNVRSQQFFFTGDSNSVLVGQGVFTYTRQCAPIPKPHDDPNASLSWVKPGYTVNSVKSASPIETEIQFLANRMTINGAFITGAEGYYYNLRFNVPKAWIELGIAECSVSYTGTFRIGQTFKSSTRKIYVRGRISVIEEAENDMVLVLCRVKQIIGVGGKVLTDWGSIPSSNRRMATITPEALSASSVKSAAPVSETISGFKRYTYVLDLNPNAADYRRPVFRIVDKNGQETNTLTEDTKPTFGEFWEKTRADPPELLLISWSGLHRWLGPISYYEEAFVRPYLT